MPSIVNRDSKTPAKKRKPKSVGVKKVASKPKPKPKKKK